MTPRRTTKRFQALVERGRLHGRSVVRRRAIAAGLGGFRGLQRLLNAADPAFATSRAATCELSSTAPPRPTLGAWLVMSF